MAFSVNTNNEAMAALRMLSATNKSLSTTQERINSGLKVGSAKDDASTFAIAQTMRGDIAAFKAVGDSLALGQATTNVALAGATSISNTLNLIKGKVQQAQEGNVDRTKIQADIKAMVGQVNTVIASASFNGVNLLKTASADLTVMSGIKTTDTITVNHQDVEAVAGTLGGIDVASESQELQFAAGAAFVDNDTIDMTANGTTYTFEFIEDPTTTASTLGSNIVVQFDSTKSLGENLASFATEAAKKGITLEFNSSGNMVASAQGGVSAASGSAGSMLTDLAVVSAGNDPSLAIATIDAAIASVADATAGLGTDINKLSNQGDFVKSLTDTIESGLGQLVDANLAEESAKLQALQTKQQLGIQALSIANQQPGSILSLFR